MKKISHVFLALVLILANFFFVFPANEAFAGANDFYFKKFNADYYLKKQKDNSSEMTVEETLTAVFPSYNQNHGIERVIPFLNQNDTNLTMESITSLDISVTRNGVSEPFTVKTYDNRFLVRIGDPDTYVHGENTYVLKYKFIHVITNFDYSGYANEAYQELYWDSNGTGWSQKFDEVNVNLHMDDSIYKNLKSEREISKQANYKNKSLIHENNTTKDKLAAWCYVGRSGSSNQDRCTISDLKDGINFNAKNLKSGENLTFVTNFNEKTFEVPKNDYIMELSFKNINIDYYLSKDENGHAKMKVVEKFVGLFPTKNETRSFSRKIPFTNSDLIRFITKSQDKLDVKLTMDGKEIEAFNYADSDDGYFPISNYKDDEYLHGEHTFTLTYEYQDVIEQQDDFQVLATNPLYKFYNDVNVLNVTLHLDDSVKNELNPQEFIDIDGKSAFSCHVGKAPKEDYSKKNCNYYSDGNTTTYSTENLSSSTNLYIYAFFNKDTFFIPKPNKNYVYYHIFALVVVLCGGAFLVVYLKAYRKVGDKIKYLKNRPLVPEYTPLKDLTAGQAAKAYLGHTKNPRVATMLELIIEKKIELIKGEKKFFGGYEWSGKVLNLSNISDEQRDLLKIMNGGHSLDHVGDTFKIKSHSYSRTLEDAFENYDSHIKHKLKSGGYLVEEKVDAKKVIKQSFGIVVAISLGSIFLIGFIVAFVEWYKEFTNFTPFSVYEGKFLLPFTIIILFITLLIIPILSGKISKYKTRTEKALDVTRYLNGLKLYIKMAEKDRLEFLQSVENVDTSEEGIVRLNEKLLPYAALFGLEKSWMKELSKYYELHEENTPDWYTAGFNYSVASSIARTATYRPIDTSSSSGGWSGGGFSSSSGSSGGGGGGFSGGGGGGGGGGGW